MYLAYNDAELAIVQAAAGREKLAPGAWAARAVLAVAKETLMPVSADATDVLRELIRARNELSRIGTEWSRIARVPNAGEEAAPPRSDAVGSLVEKALERVDDATLQVMRERQQRS